MTYLTTKKTHHLRLVRGWLLTQDDLDCEKLIMMIDHELDFRSDKIDKSTPALLKDELVKAIFDQAKIGRPSESLDKILQVRVTSDEKAAIKKAAGKKSISAYARKVLKKNLKKTLDVQEHDKQ